MLFCDLPDEVRLAYREIVDRNGGLVETYDGDCLQVAIPCPSGPFYAAMEGAGLVLVEESLHYFPLGTDNPPNHLRHDGPYLGSKGFWMFGRLKPNEIPCDHNAMVAHDEPGFAWKCADCGYVYGEGEHT